MRAIAHADDADPLKPSCEARRAEFALVSATL